MIFNISAGLQVCIVAIPVALAWLAAKLLGLPREPVALLVGFLLVMPLDLLWRISTMGGGEDEEEKAGCLNVIWPSGGGHLMFIPMWLIGMVGAVRMVFRLVRHL